MFLKYRIIIYVLVTAFVHNLYCKFMIIRFFLYIYISVGGSRISELPLSFSVRRIELIEKTIEAAAELNHDSVIVPYVCFL